MKYFLKGNAYYMLSFIKPKRIMKQLLSFCLLYIFYIIVGEIWFLVLYMHENWVNYRGILIITLLLVPVYTFINLRLSLGIGKYIFFIPILPSFIGVLLFQPIENSFYPYLYTQDDLGAGILMMMIALPHWVAMMVSFWLAHILKNRNKKA